MNPDHDRLATLLDELRQHVADEPDAHRRIAASSGAISTLWSAMNELGEIRREAVRELSAAGSGPRGIASGSGVSAPRVSQIQRDLRRAGRLPPRHG